MSDDRIQFSERLGKLSHRQLQAALDRFELGKLVDVQVPTGGMFGQNLFLRAESGDWVFRGAPHWFRGKPHPTWQLAKERWFAERIARDTSLPAPWPYLVETSPEVFGWAYALMPRLPGDRAEVALKGAPLDERLAIARAMGKALAELHSLRGPAAGEYDPDLDAIAPVATVRDHGLRAFAEPFGHADAPPSTLDAEDRVWIERVTREADTALAVPVEPSCIHLDYHWSNLNVARDADGWRVSGVFDLMGCEFGDPEMDLSRPVSVFAFEDRPLVPAFLEGYCAVRPLRSGARERFRFFMLIDRLIIWSFGHRTNRGWFAKDLRFRDWARFFLDFDSHLPG